MTAAILVAAVGLDSLTFATVIWPAGAEANGLVVALGAELALLIRWAAVGVGLVAWLHRRKHPIGGRRILLVGAIAGVVGASSNVLSILQAVHG